MMPKMASLVSWPVETVSSLNSFHGASAAAAVASG
jgi:hypothetical protein